MKKKPSNHASNFILNGGNIPKPVSQIIDVLVAARRRGFQIDVVYTDKSVDYIVKHAKAPIEWQYRMPDKTGFDYKLPAPDELPLAVTQIINCLVASRRRGFRVTLNRDSRQFEYTIGHASNAMTWKCTLPDIDGFKDKVVLQ